MKFYKYMCGAEVKALYNVLRESIHEAEEQRYNASGANSFWYCQGRINALKEVLEIVKEYVIEEE